MPTLSVDCPREWIWPLPDKSCSLFAKTASGFIAPRQTHTMVSGIDGILPRANRDTSSCAPNRDEFLNSQFNENSHSPKRAFRAPAAIHDQRRATLSIVRRQTSDGSVVWSRQPLNPGDLLGHPNIPRCKGYYVILGKNSYSACLGGNRGGECTLFNIVQAGRRKRPQNPIFRQTPFPSARIDLSHAWQR